MLGARARPHRPRVRSGPPLCGFSLISTRILFFILLHVSCADSAIAGATMDNLTQSLREELSCQGFFGGSLTLCWWIHMAAWWKKRERWEREKKTQNMSCRVNVMGNSIIVMQKYVHRFTEAAHLWLLRSCQSHCFLCTWRLWTLAGHTMINYLFNMWIGTAEGVFVSPCSTVHASGFHRAPWVTFCPFCFGAF